MKASDTVRTFTEKAAKVRLPGGIFGKTCYVLIAVCGAFATIAWAARSPTVAYVALGLLSIIILFGLWRMFDFAHSHPEVAVLEGAELLHLREIQLAQKGRGEIPVTTSEASDPSSPLLAADAKATLELPDPEESDSSQSKRRRPNG